MSKLRDPSIRSDSRMSMVCARGLRLRARSPAPHRRARGSTNAGFVWFPNRRSLAQSVLLLCARSPVCVYFNLSTCKLHMHTEPTNWLRCRPRRTHHCHIRSHSASDSSTGHAPRAAPRRTADRTYAYTCKLWPRFQIAAIGPCEIRSYGRPSHRTATPRGRLESSHVPSPRPSTHDRGRGRRRGERLALGHAARRRLGRMWDAISRSISRRERRGSVVATATAGDRAGDRELESTQPRVEAAAARLRNDRRG